MSDNPSMLLVLKSFIQLMTKSSELSSVLLR